MPTGPLADLLNQLTDAQLRDPFEVARFTERDPSATVADWVYHNPKTINPGVSTSIPMCATGNSGGSAVIAYAVYNYGLDGEFKMIEPTSGPVTAMAYGGKDLDYLYVASGGAVYRRPVKIKGTAAWSVVKPPKPPL